MVMVSVAANFGQYDNIGLKKLFKIYRIHLIS